MQPRCVICGVDLSKHEEADHKFVAPSAYADTSEGRLREAQDLRHSQSSREVKIIRDYIEMQAAKRAIAAEMGVSEWEAFLTDEDQAALDALLVYEGERLMCEATIQCMQESFNSLLKDRDSYKNALTQAHRLVIETADRIGSRRA